MEQPKDSGCQEEVKNRITERTEKQLESSSCFFYEVIKMDMASVHEQLDSRIEELAALFIGWNHVKEHGSASPIWTDGQDLNFIRGKMERLEKEIRSLAVQYHIEVRLEELPPKMSDGYMQKAGKIKEMALETFEKCYGEEYLFILRNTGGLDEGQKEETGVVALFARMGELAVALERDNAVKLKKYGDSRPLLEEIRGCKKKVEELLEELQELEEPPDLPEPEEIYEQMELF